MSRLDRCIIVILLLLIVGLQSYGTLQQSSLLSYGAYLKSVVERMKQMAHYQASWTSGGVTYIIIVDQVPGQTPEEAEAIFEQRLAVALKKHPRDQ